LIYVGSSLENDILVNLSIVHYARVSIQVGWTAKILPLPEAI